MSGPSPTARGRVTSLFARAGMAVPGRAGLERLLDRNPRPRPSPPLPPGAEEVLRPDHPRLAELAARYQGHPAAQGSLWSAGYARTVRLPAFRADNAYVWQRRGHACAAAYALTTFYVRQHDRLGLLGRLDEDGLFGADSFDVDGAVVSRDLLDSVLQLTFVDELLGLSSLPSPVVVDVGAGYGRLGHRATAAFAGLRWMCTDAVAVSTFLSEYYLAFRGAERAPVVALDGIGAALAAAGPLTAAVNVHSFEECPQAATRWWLRLLADTEVPALVVVANGSTLVSRERSGARLPLAPELAAVGYRLEASRPKFAHSEAVQRAGLFPAHHFLFARR
ncbi:MAG: hypothetical protein ABR511_05665 [Acidimicrobiales bacterium]